MIRMVLGVVTVPLGVLLWGWILYNLLVQRVTDHEGSPFPAMIFGSALIFVGGKWVLDGWNSWQEGQAERPVKRKKTVKNVTKRRPVKPLEPLDD